MSIRRGLLDANGTVNNEAISTPAFAVVTGLTSGAITPGIGRVQALAEVFALSGGIQTLTFQIERDGVALGPSSGEIQTGAAERVSMTLFGEVDEDGAAHTYRVQAASTGAGATMVGTKSRLRVVKWEG